MRDKIQKSAAELVALHGLINLSKRALCARVGIPDGSFSHFMSMTFLEFVAELKSSDASPLGSDPVHKSRADPDLRRAQILNVALHLAESSDYTRLTRSRVALAAGVSAGLVTKYFGSMGALKSEIMRAAIGAEVLPIVAAGIVNGDPEAAGINSELKIRALSNF